MTTAVIIRNSTVAGNAAAMYAGGVAQLSGSLQVVNSAIKDNTAGRAAGVYGLIAAITVTRSTIAGNRATVEGGGGIFVEGGSGDLTVDQSTVSGNRAADGGGISVADGDALIRNSTISGNRARDDGGGVYAGETSGATNTVLNNVTVAGNVADSDLINGGSGGGVFRASGGLLLYNTLLGDNSDRSLPGEQDCDGGIGAVYSLIEDDCSGIGSNNVLADPKLKDLATNGGRTRTQALRAGSPAINAASPEAPGSSESACQPTDQRGVPRPAGAACDIGAFERQSAP
jgi:hypothetical protein